MDSMRRTPYMKPQQIKTEKESGCGMGNVNGRGVNVIAQASTQRQRGAYAKQMARSQSAIVPRDHSLGKEGKGRPNCQGKEQILQAGKRYGYMFASRLLTARKKKWESVSSKRLTSCSIVAGPKSPMSDCLLIQHFESDNH